MLIANQMLLGKIAGVLVAGFGLHTMGILNIPWLDRQKRWTYKGSTGRPHQSFVIGMAFAAGWTPCVGPILGGILAIASVHATLWDGVTLLFSYAIGMGLPFLLMAATIGKSTALLDTLKRRHRTIEVTSGLLLIERSASCSIPTPSPPWPDTSTSTTSSDLCPTAPLSRQVEGPLPAAHHATLSRARSTCSRSPASVNTSPGSSRVSPLGMTFSRPRPIARINAPSGKDKSLRNATESRVADGHFVNADCLVLLVEEGEEVGVPHQVLHDGERG